MRLGPGRRGQCSIWDALSRGLRTPVAVLGAEGLHSPPGESQTWAVAGRETGEENRYEGRRKERRREKEGQVNREGGNTPLRSIPSTEQWSSLGVEAIGKFSLKGLLACGSQHGAGCGHSELPGAHLSPR